MTPRKSRSGTNLTREQRRANGQRCVELWLPTDVVTRIDALCEAHGLTRPELIAALVIEAPTK